MITGMKSQGGGVVLIVAMVLALLAAVVDTTLLNMDNRNRNAQSFSDKTKAFYVSEGVRHISTVLIEDFFIREPYANEERVVSYLEQELPKLIPSPYSITKINAKILQQQTFSIIPTGPFAGMSGPMTELELAFSVKAPSSVFSGDINEPLKLRISIGYLAMFQFMLFYDLEVASLQTGPDFLLNGRVHANNDLCIGGSKNGQYQYFRTITAAGRLMTTKDTRCPALAFTTSRGNNVKISKDGSFSNFAAFSSSADNGCVNCLGLGLDWKAFALKYYGGQALDKAHNVQKLRLLSAGLGLTQNRTAGNFGSADNSKNLRFLVDPPLPSDNDSVLKFKLAANADIRIINGVWYLKNKTGVGSTWPGFPIWSDHPGHYVENGIAVGQDDIRARWASTPNSWPAAPATPRAFSYYEYDSTAESIQDDATGEGVISYGNLFKGAGVTAFKPGYWLASGNSPLCFGTNVNCGASGCGFKNVWDASSVTCPSSVNPSRATLLLNSTRSGFFNGNISSISPGTALEREQRARILPVNFDVSQFQTALQNKNAGELGSYFGAANLMNGEFNGIIFIDSNWPGATDGFGSGFPLEPPWHGNDLRTDASNAAPQIAVTHATQERPLPQPLCSDSLKGHAFDTVVAGVNPPASRFKIPDCANYVGNGDGSSWPNSIRIVNGSTLNPSVFTKGLSIVTPKPVYMTGDFNTSSDTSSITSGPWVSSLIAGDKVGFISNNWSDSLSTWQNKNTVPRLPTETTYNMALLTNPNPNLMTLLEDWNNVKLNYNGSIVFGFDGVYALHTNAVSALNTYYGADRIFNYDPHFNLVANQPPGTPVFSVSATVTWTKD